MPLAALKRLPDGNTEVGSWAFRKTLTADTQLHITLFEVREEVAIYAHLEPSAINPLTAYKHFASAHVDAKGGVEQAREKLPSELF
jgi:hypothetical protein